MHNKQRGRLAYLHLNLCPGCSKDFKGVGIRVKNTHQDAVELLHKAGISTSGRFRGYVVLLCDDCEKRTGDLIFLRLVRYVVQDFLLNRMLEGSQQGNRFNIIVGHDIAAAQ